MSETMDTTTMPAKRPAFLTVLCILSFIAAGFGIIGMLFMGAARGVADANGMSVSAEVATNQGVSAEAAATAEAVLSWPYIITALILIVIGLVGVIQMWKLKKSGFYIYTVTQIAGLIVPVVFGMAFPVFGTVMAVAFIVMYGLNLKAMR